MIILPQLIVKTALVNYITYNCIQIKLLTIIEMLACTERQFVRTYPHGTRVDSSNYDPIPLWNHGVHMVALNVQTPGKELHAHVILKD